MPGLTTAVHGGSVQRSGKGCRVLTICALCTHVPPASRADCFAMPLLIHAAVALFSCAMFALVNLLLIMADHELKVRYLRCKAAGPEHRGARCCCSHLQLGLALGVGCTFSR